MTPRLFKYLDPITEGLSEERKNQLIETMTRRVVEHGLIAPAIIFLESVKPLAKVGSYTLILFSAPILGLFGINGYELVGFFSDRQNLEQLTKRLEEAAKK
jgi:hypothetical protein